MQMREKASRGSGNVGLGSTTLGLLYKLENTAVSDDNRHTGGATQLPPQPTAPPEPWFIRIQGADRRVGRHDSVEVDDVIAIPRSVNERTGQLVQNSDTFMKQLDVVLASYATATAQPQ